MKCDYLGTIFKNCHNLQSTYLAFPFPTFWDVVCSVPVGGAGDEGRYCYGLWRDLALDLTGRFLFLKQLDGNYHHNFKTSFPVFKAFGTHPQTIIAYGTVAALLCAASTSGGSTSEGVCGVWCGAYGLKGEDRLCCVVSSGRPAGRIGMSKNNFDELTDSGRGFGEGVLAGE